MARFKKGDIVTPKKSVFPSLKGKRLRILRSATTPFTFYNVKHKGSVFEFHKGELKKIKR